MLLSISIDTRIYVRISVIWCDDVVGIPSRLRRVDVVEL